jgi:transposase-like protein
MAKGHGQKLGRKKEAAIVALLAHDTIPKAAASIGVHAQSLKNWLKDEGFRRAFKQARRAVLDDALGHLHAVSREAVDTLRKLLKAKGESVRLGACRAILELGVKLRESIELEERIEALENKGKPR